jgi:hypothetical protein
LTNAGLSFVNVQEIDECRGKFCKCTKDMTNAWVSFVNVQEI